VVKPLLQPFPFPTGHRAQALRYQPRYRRPLHFHAEPEVNLIWAGRARFVVGERSFEVSSGSLLMLPPGIEHALMDASADLEFFAIGFEPALVAAVERETGTRMAFGVEHRVLSAAGTRRFVAWTATRRSWTA
jgi:mannose-6-phosphate isomerase-like protein (cupin superfamily)